MRIYTSSVVTNMILMSSNRTKIRIYSSSVVTNFILMGRFKANYLKLKLKMRMQMKVAQKKVMVKKLLMKHVPDAGSKMYVFHLMILM